MKNLWFFWFIENLGSDFYHCFGLATDQKRILGLTTTIPKGWFWLLVFGGAPTTPHFGSKSWSKHEKQWKRGFTRMGYHAVYFVFLSSPCTPRVFYDSLIIYFGFPRYCTGFWEPGFWIKNLFITQKNNEMMGCTQGIFHCRAVGAFHSRPHIT